MRLELRLKRRNGEGAARGGPDLLLRVNKETPGRGVWMCFGDAKRLSDVVRPRGAYGRTFRASDASLATAPVLVAPLLAALIPMCVHFLSVFERLAQ
jgi:hypothetical protein